MGDGTKIEWTDATWNPIIGCSRVSPGCDNCYAIGVVHREMSPQHVGLTTKSIPVDWTGEVRPAPQSVLEKPLHWKRSRRIFVNSLSDLFHADLPDEEVAKVFAVMALAPQHTFQVLTKRSKRMRELLGSPHFEELVIRHKVEMAVDKSLADLLVWPLPNVWLGVSIEDDKWSFRADHLRDTPAAVRMISAEPLLGPLPSLDLTGIDWLIVGGESGPKAHPMHPAWVRDMRDRCTDEVIACSTCGDDAGQTAPCASTGDPDFREYECLDGHVTTRPAFFFKQWGEWVPDGQMPKGTSLPGIGYRGGPGQHPWPDDGQAVYKVGKKAAGRELDGRTWDEYPA